MRIKFSTKQVPLYIVIKGDKAYYYIHLNETHGYDEEEIYDSETESTIITQVEYYEYDYNEFIESIDFADKTDIQIHPEKYLNYHPHIMTKDELIANLQAQVAMLTEGILELSEIVYQ